MINNFDGNGILTGNSSFNDSNNVSLQGNFIGTDASGTLDLGNGLAGVVDLGDGHSTVGGTGLDDRNLISGNEEDGVLVSSDDSLVQGNVIGLKKDGLSALGNSRDGVRVLSGEGNKIRQNSISSNGALGIDLGGDGPTPNDAGDADAGANELQNKPLIASAKTGATGTTITATLNSVPDRTFLIEFFSNPSTDRAEGKKLIGEKSVTTGSDGKITFTFKPQAKVPRGQFVTATATGRPEFFDVLTETSEFSAPKKVVRP